MAHETDDQTTDSKDEQGDGAPERSDDSLQDRVPLLYENDALGG